MPRPAALALALVALAASAAAGAPGDAAAPSVAAAPAPVDVLPPAAAPQFQTVRLERKGRGGGNNWGGAVGVCSFFEARRAVGCMLGHAEPPRPLGTPFCALIRVLTNEGET